MFLNIGGAEFHKNVPLLSESSCLKRFLSSIMDKDILSSSVGLPRAVTLMAAKPIKSSSLNRIEL